MARRPHHRQRIDRRSRQPGLSARRRPRRRGKPIPAPTLVYRHNEHVVAVTELPLDARGALGGGGVETIDGYHVARWSDAELSYVAVSDIDEKTLAQFVGAFRQARQPAAEEKR